VPGAMVSVVCSNALNRAIKEFRLTYTGQILDKVTDLVLQTFEKSINEIKDGMDISILSINKETKQIHWSGANTPLLYFVDKTFKEIKADKQPIGYSENPTLFKTHSIAYLPKTNFYLFTDGYADQFGGPKGKKLKNKLFKETITKNLNKNCFTQKLEIETVFNTWKGDLEQVDDVCVIGIGLP
jgi:Stage II sporulation protein E (SpoIIE)